MTKDVAAQELGLLSQLKELNGQLSKAFFRMYDTMQGLEESSAVKAALRSTRDFCMPNLLAKLIDLEIKAARKKMK